MKNFPETKKEKPSEFTENLDFYFEDGLMILTAGFLLKRGRCCGNDCRNCPYPKEKPAHQS